MAKSDNNKKCYNSISCILSVVIILVLLGSVAYDNLVRQPERDKKIDDIYIKIERINEKIDEQYGSTTYVWKPEYVNYEIDDMDTLELLSLNEKK